MMGEYLTPEQVENLIAEQAAYERSVHNNTGVRSNTAATLREYAAIVEAVTTDEPLVTYYDGNHTWITECSSCHGVAADGELNHSPDCTYLRARKVRGYE